VRVIAKRTLREFWEKHPEYKMKIKPIKTEKDYEAALQRIDELFDTVKKGTPEGDEFEILTILVEKYEDEHFPIDAPDPIEAIKFMVI